MLELSLFVKCCDNKKKKSVIYKTLSYKWSISSLHFI